MISHYKICEPIGSGYSCKVYKAQSQINQEVYAIKVLNHTTMKDEQKQLLKTEIEILQSVKCQNIIKLYDVIQSPNQTFLVTELCLYGSLEDQMNKNKLFNEQQALNFLNQICNALLTLKKQRIIHNDIKPSNIFLSENCFKLADFGFAMKLSKQFAFNCGSPLYMSPETLKDNQHTYQSDIWSLGITLYQLVYGYTPFKVQNEKELLTYYNTKQIQFNSGISQKLQTILQSMLEVDPNKRIQIERLQSFLFEKENVKLQRLKSLHNEKQPFRFKEQTLNVCQFVKSIRSEIQDNDLLSYALTGIFLYYTQQEQRKILSNLEFENNQITVIVEQQKQPNIFQMVRGDLLKFCLSQLHLSINILMQQLQLLDQKFYSTSSSAVKLLINLYNLYLFIKSGDNQRSLVLVNENITYLEAMQLLSQIYI